MIEFVAANWGGLVSVLGVLVSSAGLGWAIIAARRARRASQAAQEARDYFARQLQAADLERAIALIQRIKDLHNGDRWQTAMEQYQPLRAMLADISARCPESQSELSVKLDTARALVTRTENFVGERAGQAIENSERSEINQGLNLVQSALEELSSALGFGNSPGERK